MHDKIEKSCLRTMADVNVFRNRCARAAHAGILNSGSERRHTAHIIAMYPEISCCYTFIIQNEMGEKNSLINGYASAHIMTHVYHVESFRYISFAHIPLE